MTLPLSYSRLRASQLPLPRRFGAASPLGALETCVRRGVLPSIITAEAGSPNRTRGIPLACQAETRLALAFQLARRAEAARAVTSARRRLVAREGLEPSKPLGRQIYSLLRLTASLPRQLSVCGNACVRMFLCMPMELAKGFEPPTC